MSEAERAPVHLYEFESGGFYAATSKEDAFALYNADSGEDPSDDFKREVPDDEEIAVVGESPEDRWDDPREYECKGHWALKVTAREWANSSLTHGRGHVFGGYY